MNEAKPVLLGLALLCALALGLTALESHRVAKAQRAQERWAELLNEPALLNETNALHEIGVRLQMPFKAQLARTRLWGEGQVATCVQVLATGHAGTQTTLVYFYQDQRLFPVDSLDYPLCRGFLIRETRW